MTDSYLLGLTFATAFSGLFGLGFIVGPRIFREPIMAGFSFVGAIIALTLFY